MTAVTFSLDTDTRSPSGPCMLAAVEASATTLDAPGDGVLILVGSDVLRCGQ